jgi:predicted 2-oxoglutarate/Fe(II)-dependent dioxygenase YbiX
MMRCLKHTDRPFQNCEKLQILRYKSGGYYKPHQDAFENDSNMRLYTFILALNDDYEGGETVFPNLGKEYKLKAGDALFFDTLDNYECMTSKALHGGKPVKSGEKWICNLWVRKYPY